MIGVEDIKYSFQMIYGIKFNHYNSVVDTFLRLQFNIKDTDLAVKTLIQELKGFYIKVNDVTHKFNKIALNDIWIEVPIQSIESLLDTIQQKYSDTIQIEVLSSPPSEIQVDIPNIPTEITVVLPTAGEIRNQRKFIAISEEEYKELCKMKAYNADIIDALKKFVCDFNLKF